MPADSEMVEVTVLVDRDYLLDAEPADLRRHLGEEVYAAALRKVGPEKPEPRAVSVSIHLDGKQIAEAVARETGSSEKLR